MKILSALCYFMKVMNEDYTCMFAFVCHTLNACELFCGGGRIQFFIGKFYQADSHYHIDKFKS